MSKKNNVRKTSARMVMDVLKNNGAYTESSAISVDKFKNLKLSSQVIAYTISNLMQDNVVGKTDDDKYYFNEKGWKALEKKVNAGYIILIAVPIFFIIVMLLIQYLF